MTQEQTRFFDREGTRLSTPTHSPSRSMQYDAPGTLGYGAWGAGPQGPPMLSYAGHDMLAPMSELLVRRVHEEIARGITQQKEEANRV